MIVAAPEACVIQLYPKLAPEWYRKPQNLSSSKATNEQTHMIMLCYILYYIAKTYNYTIYTIIVVCYLLLPEGCPGVFSRGFLRTSFLMASRSGQMKKGDSFPGSRVAVQFS